MSATKIEWTDHTINPGIYGCGIESPACTNCYAMGMAARLERMGRAEYAGTTRDGRWTGEVRVDYAAIRPAFASLPKAKPARVFVTSMADLFHADVPDAFILAVFEEMAARPHLTFQVLTKRIARVPDWFAGRVGGYRWPANVWIGTTVEDQRRADERIPHLLRVPARVRFLSMEPLLSGVNLERWLWASGVDGEPAPRNEPHQPCLHWVIAGGESGPRARPTDPAWARSLRDQCAATDVPFFWKQWGRWVPAEGRWEDGFSQGEARRYPLLGGPPMLRVGKAAAGCLLDGREHKATPEPTP